MRTHKLPRSKTTMLKMARHVLWHTELGAELLDVPAWLRQRVDLTKLTKFPRNSGTPLAAERRAAGASRSRGRGQR